MAFFRMIRVEQSIIPPSSAGRTAMMVVNDSKFEQDVLMAHNNFRASHGSPPLTLNRELTNLASQWVLKLCREERYEYRPNNRFGESIYIKFTNDPNATVTGNEAVSSWYSEIKDHVFDREPRVNKAGHFCQVVWKNTREIGVCRGKSDRGTFVVVCNYNPPGNIAGEFSANCLPRRPSALSVVSSTPSGGRRSLGYDTIPDIYSFSHEPDNSDTNEPMQDPQPPERFITVSQGDIEDFEIPIPRFLQSIFSGQDAPPAPSDNTEQPVPNEPESDAPPIPTDSYESRVPTFSTQPDSDAPLTSSNSSDSHVPNYFAQQTDSGETPSESDDAAPSASNLGSIPGVNIVRSQTPDGPTTFTLDAAPGITFTIPQNAVLNMSSDGSDPSNTTFNIPPGTTFSLTTGNSPAPPTSE